MKTKSITMFLFLTAALWVRAGNSLSPEHKGYRVEFSQTRGNQINLNFTLDKVTFSEVTENGKIYSKLDNQIGVLSTQKGYSELPIIHAAVQLAPDKNVTMQVEKGSYTDYTLKYPLLPSRGVIKRSQDPSKIPYQIDPASVVDAWYPADNAILDSPYIIRDVRGTNVYVNPIQYNAAKNILRVYNTINVNLIENNTIPVNPLTVANKQVTSEAFDLYKSVFINFNKRSNWTNEAGEAGELLVIYTSRDAAAIQPYISWKKQMGFKVTEQTVSKGIDVTSTIKTAYGANNKIFYVLLVGDWEDMKCALTTDGAGYSGGTDPMLGCVVGTDSYPDISIGRFSAASATDVTTQVNKTVSYEKVPAVGGTWYKNSITIGGSDGPGDDNELDNAQVMNIYTKKLKPSTYTNNSNCDASSNASSVSTPLNSAAGVGIINYCGHGNVTVWGTTGFSNSNISTLTNVEKLPFIISVACLCGQYNGQTCFAEAWMRKTGGGAVLAMMSSVEQDWNPPMIGQDYMNDLLVGGHSYSGSESGTNTDHGKTHFGSIALNGGILMYTEDKGALLTLKTWCTFGDPSLQVRTDAPKALVASNLNIPTGSYQTTVTVGGSPFANALVSIWDGTGQPFSALTDASGNVTIPHTLASGTSVTLTITGFNLVPYISTVTIGVTSVNNTDLSNSLQVFPNPNNGNFELNYSLLNKENSNVKIVDLLGNTVYSGVLMQNAQTKTVTLNGVQNGLYFLSFENSNGTVTKKITIEK
jgi:Peptidase family C25/Propeptide_C25/Secretion system C-terminal sorting domain